MVIAVTGANGHVGINLCQELIRHGHSVRALMHKHNEAIRHIPVEQIPGDILNRESLDPLVKGADVVFHLAAKISISGDNDNSVKAINILGTKNIVEASRANRVQKFIHFSSIHAFDHHPTDQHLDESRPLVTNSPFSYDMSKAEGERIVMQAANEGFNALVVCPTAIIGPADYEPSLIGKAIVDLYNRSIPALVPGGYNWVDVRDIVTACINAIDKGRPGEKYILSGTWRSLRDVSEIVANVSGGKTTSLVLPFWMAKLGLPFIQLYCKMSGTIPPYTRESLLILENGNKLIRNEKAMKELDFQPRALEKTINDLFQWFKLNNIVN